MKDTVITARTKKRELAIFAACVVLAFLVNAYAIATYETTWSEMYTMIGMVLTIGVTFYAVQGLIRLLIRGLLRLVRGSTE